MSPDLGPDDPFSRFRALFEEAKRLYPQDYNAMTLATVGDDGRPSARVVLLKGADERGFVFYTNFESRKGRDLLAHPWAALCFYWPAMDQQVRVEGKVEQVSDEEADAYFSSRPRGSQAGAWASKQSQPLNSREALERRYQETLQQHVSGAIPRPPHWSGFRVVPDHIEFWRAGKDRLHVRTVFSRSGDRAWVKSTLQP